jgi:hypothetical protein
VLPPSPPLRVKSATGEVLLLESFSVGLFPNRAGQFPITLRSSDHFRTGATARPTWMFSWQERQITRVLRGLLAMRCIHAGLSGRPGLVEVGELADVMNLEVLLGCADLAASGK